MSLDSACERDWDEKFGDKITEEEWQRRMNNDKPMGESGITYGEHWQEKYKRKNFAEWQANWHKRHANDVALAETSLQEPQKKIPPTSSGISGNELSNTPLRQKVTTKLSTPNHSLPGLSFDSSIASPRHTFAKGLHSSDLTPLSESNSMLQSSIVPSPIVTGSQTNVSIAFII